MENINLRIEKKGDRGKRVTILDGFTRHEDYLLQLARRLKKTCGAGGTLKNGKIEIQGDSRLKIREFLLKEGFQVKG